MAAFTLNLPIPGAGRRGPSLPELMTQEVAPEMDALRAQLERGTPYRSIASGWAVEPRTEGSDSVTFTLLNRNPIWVFRENDVRAHWVPFGPGTPLWQWAQAHNIPAFLVARKIAREGTKGDQIVARVWAQYPERIQHATERALKRMVAAQFV